MKIGDCAIINPNMYYIDGILVNELVCILKIEGNSVLVQMNNFRVWTDINQLAVISDAEAMLWKLENV